MDFKVAVHTDKGTWRDTNQDSVLVKIARTDRGRVLLAAICDGMGGLERGEAASAALARMLSVWFGKEFPRIYYQGFSMELVRRSLAGLAARANERIGAYGQSRGIRLGTTMAVLLLADGRYCIGNVGDSRVYLLKGELRQLTKDQTFVQQELDAGRMTREEARRDSRRNVLLQCVGASQSVVPDYFTGNAQRGSLFLLCSDGLCHVVSGTELYGHLDPHGLQGEQRMKEGLAYLTELARRRGETDNISAALIRVD